MELFKLFGTIAIKNDEANQAIDDTSTKAESSGSKIANAFKKIGLAITENFKKKPIDETKTSLSELSQKITSQETELAKLKSKYQDLYLAQGKNSDEAKECAKEIEKLSEELSQNKGKLQEAENAADKFDKSLDKMGDETNVAENRISSSFKAIAATVAASLSVAALSSFGKGCLEAAANAEAMKSQFSQVFGNVEKDASKSLSKISKSAGINENRMKGSFTKIAAFAKTTGMDTGASLKLSERAMIAVADSAAFYDRSLEETTESLQSFLKGNYENDAALGLSCTEVTRNAAANKLYGKSFQQLSEDQKQLTLLQMVEDANKASGALGQASRESDTWTNVIGNLQQSWRDFQAIIGNAVLPTAVNVVKSMADKISTLAEKMPAVIDFFKEYKGALEFVAVIIGIVTAAMTAQTIVQGIQTAINVAEADSLAGLIAMKIASAKATLLALAPYLLIAAAVAAVIAIGVLLYKNWDKIKAKASELKEKLSEVWNGIKEKISSVWEGIKTAISNALQKIKNVIKTVLNGIKIYITTVLNIYKKIFKVGFNVVKTVVTTVFNAIKNVIKNGLNGAKNVVTSVLESIKGAFSKVLGKALSIVKNMIHKIKSAFNFKWSLPKLKLPHFSVKGKFKLDPPSIPKFSVSWYKKAMDEPYMFTKPTIFGANPLTGTAMGAGEAGDEIMYGKNNLMNDIRNAVAVESAESMGKMVDVLGRIFDILAQYVPEMANTEIVLDDGALVGKITPKIDKALGNIVKHKGRGN